MIDTEISLSAGEKDEDLKVCPRQALGYVIRQEAQGFILIPSKLISEKHYSTDIDNKLRQLIANGHMSQLTGYLKTLSNARFRTAGYVLGECVMQQCSSAQFWSLAKNLVQYDNRAFLVTVLKAYKVRSERVGDVNLRDAGFQNLCSLSSFNEEDRKKTIQQLLPTQKNPDEIRYLFSLLSMNDQAQWIPFLLRCRSLPCYFLLFNSLHFIEHDTDRLVRIACYLIRSGDTLSFNLASLIKAYFGLVQVKGTFSLTLEPYELSRIASSYSVFCQKMQF